MTGDGQTEETSLDDEADLRGAHHVSHSSSTQDTVFGCVAVVVLVAGVCMLYAANGDWDSPLLAFGLMGVGMGALLSYYALRYSDMTRAVGPGWFLIRSGVWPRTRRLRLAEVRAVRSRWANGHGRLMLWVGSGSRIVVPFGVDAVSQDLAAQLLAAQPDTDPRTEILLASTAQPMTWTQNLSARLQRAENLSSAARIGYSRSGRRLWVDPARSWLITGVALMLPGLLPLAVLTLAGPPRSSGAVIWQLCVALTLAGAALVALGVRSHHRDRAVDDRMRGLPQRL